MLRVPIYNVKCTEAAGRWRFVHNKGMMLPALIALSATLAAPVPLGTHETFGCTVNGVRTGATIHVACFGPNRPVVGRHVGRTSKAALVSTGHPMAGQSVGVFIPEA